MSQKRQCHEPSIEIVSQDIIEGILNEIELQQTELTVAWKKLETSLCDAKEITLLEEGVVYVTNWILSTAETMLIRQLKVGHDVQSAEKCRMEHEILELQCWKTVGILKIFKYL